MASGGTQTHASNNLESTHPSRPLTPCLSLVLSSNSILVQINHLHLPSAIQIIQGKEFFSLDNLDV